MFRLACRLPAAAGAVAAVSSQQRQRRCCAEELQKTDTQKRFQVLPESLSSQRWQPAVPYPGWDDNWDFCDLSSADIAERLSHKWPNDHAALIRQLYADHTRKDPIKVEALIDANRDDLPALYKRAYATYAFGGGYTRHILLVRHGQYDEQSDLYEKLLHRESPDRFGMAGDTRADELDQARHLTALGRRQAEKTGDRLAEMLRPALTTPGREGHVRIHVSTMTRARETADLIASRLPPQVRRCAPDPNLAEGHPPAHIIPFSTRGGEEFLQGRSRDVHVEGVRLETAFRSLFYRDLPFEPQGAKADEAAQKAKLAEKAKLPKHQYEIVVCHANVMRYFTLRGLQLPPEAWLRLGGYNCSFVHLKIRPNGVVSLMSFGESGHLSLEETTFGMLQGHEE